MSVLENGGENMNLYFQLLSSLPTRFLESWDLKLKLREFFPWLGYWWIWKYVNKLIFTSKNWPNDLRVGCYSTSTLIELIEAHVSPLEEYEDEFEWNELVNM